MRILVINGSPKGEDSITYQTMLYIQACFQKHEYQVIHAGKKIKQLDSITITVIVASLSSIAMFAVAMFY